MKKTPYLVSIVNSVVIQNLFQESLNDILGIKGKYTVVPFFYPGWPTAEFIKKISFKMSDSMYKIGEKLAKEKFKNFNPEKTKLPSDIIDEIWMEASRIIAEEIYKGFEELDQNRIPGLRESIKGGAIIGRGIEDAITEEARQDIEGKIDSIDYRDELLRIFREKYFSYMQKTYDLFSEEKKEIPKVEWKPKMR